MPIHGLVLDAFAGRGCMVEEVTGCEMCEEWCGITFQTALGIREWESVERGPVLKQYRYFERRIQHLLIALRVVQKGGSICFCSYGNVVTRGDATRKCISSTTLHHIYLKYSSTRRIHGPLGYYF